MADTDFSAALTAALKTYADGVAEAVDEAAERCAKGLAKELRGTSPKRTGAYAKGWAAKQTGTSERGGKTFTVYNKTRYQLTHLLQHGHKGPAPAPAYPHIDRPAEQWQEKFVTECEEVAK